jgi:hypothetical protein
MDAEFEEKEFEGFLNQQLCTHGGVFYAPGQVLENIIGLDAALTCQVTQFWNLFPSPRPQSLYPTSVSPSGILLSSEYWDGLDSAIDHFPPIKFNLFVQHKRPSFLKSGGSKQWKYWKQPYYRYSLLSHQQSALSHLAKIAGDDALVVYSCPAFVSREELWKHGFGASLISNTNFALAEGLDGHDQYTFVGPGSSGYACSEPVEMPPFSIVQEMQARRSRKRTRFGNREFLDISAKQVLQAVAAANLDAGFETLFGYMPSEMPPIARSVLTIAALGFSTSQRMHQGTNATARE